MGTPGPFEIILILVVVLLLFGAKRIPEIARGLGSGIREFKDATNDIKKELTADPARQIQPPHQAPPQPYQAPAQPYAAPPVSAQPSQPAPSEFGAPEPVAPPPADGQAAQG